ncbi:MAG: RsmB/NOP family class I SAM-dependent RNA methyltransferase, partial [Planctomycetota bacterium]
EHAAPRWVADRLRAALGDDAGAALRALAAPAPRTLRCNLLRGSRDALRAALAREGVEVDLGRHAATAVVCRGPEDVFATRAFRDGWFEQQDEASQLAVALTAPPPRGRVLDLCAGSGGKTLGVAAALGNRGAVLAADVHAGRLRELRGRLGRAGADNVTPHLLQGDGADVASFATGCDRILVDAPCTGTGSWRRRPQARVAVTEQDLPALRRTQRDLLDRAASWLKPGARLVYATCSLLPEENVDQVRWVTSRHSELEPVRVAEILGGAAARRITDSSGMFLQLRPDLHGCDGFFAAVLRRPRVRASRRPAAPSEPSSPQRS